MDANRKLLVVAAIPPELRAKLGAAFELAEYGGIGNQGKGLPTQSGFRVAVTTSVAGARRPLMEALPDLGLIVCNGTGLENIDLPEAARRGIVVRNTPDVVTDDTADFTIGLVYALFRRIPEGDRFVRTGRWATERMTPSRRVSGKKMGIVGLGKIGAAVATRASGLGMAVSYTGPRRKEGVAFPYFADLGELAESSDVLVLCCPGGEATAGLVGGHVLQRLGPEGFLVNVARGSVVDEGALIEALAGGAIAGAAADVFQAEPDINPVFFEFDNVVLAPHYAAVTRETRQAMAAMLTEAVENFFGGRPIPNAAAGMDG